MRVSDYAFQGGEQHATAHGQNHQYTPSAMLSGTHHSSASCTRYPSRSSSPNGLRSRACVAVSTYEALSDSLMRLEEDAALRQEQLDEDGIACLSGKDDGRDREVALPSPKAIASFTSTDEPLIEAGISDYTFIPNDQGGLLGRGKFSSVQLAWKDGRKFAVKVTPLYSHHTLIATRLLREPTILAQLPPHPNLVKVYESIRTPGHFYLVEEYLDGYINLESLVASRPDQKLSFPEALHVYKQLTSVVRSALHQPIQIAHRDIKPENILVHPETLRIILLDFGLATHFSGREPKLTTCCGSPAFHAPELFLSLKSPPGSVRYWGPEVDIWTVGVTLLRCLTGHKYPLGVSHTSLQHLSDKTTDAIRSVEHKEFRGILSGILDMNGNARIEFFRNLPSDIDSYPYEHLNQHTFTPSRRDFKSTSFIPVEPKHTLPLTLLPPTSSLSPLNSPHFFASRSRSQSRDRLGAHFAAGLEMTDDAARAAAIVQHSIPSSPTPTIPELYLLNPTLEPVARVISFIKYAIRCAGILYHVQHTSDDLSKDLPSVDIPACTVDTLILHCILPLPKEAASSSPAAALLTNQLRPSLTRAQTAGPRPSPGKGPKSSSQIKKSDPPKHRCLEFWIQLIPIFAPSSPPSTARRSASKAESKKRGKSRKRRSSTEDERKCTKVRVRISDTQAMEAVVKALAVGHSSSEQDGERAELVSSVAPSRSTSEEHAEDDRRGRNRLSRSISNGEKSRPTANRRPGLQRSTTEVDRPSPAASTRTLPTAVKGGSGRPTGPVTNGTQPQRSETTNSNESTRSGENQGITRSEDSSPDSPQIKTPQLPDTRALPHNNPTVREVSTRRGLWDFAFNRSGSKSRPGSPDISRPNSPAPGTAVAMDSPALEMPNPFNERGGSRPRKAKTDETPIAAMAALAFV